MCPLIDALHSQLSNLKKDENLTKTILVHVESEFKQHIFKIYIVNQKFSAVSKAQKQDKCNMVTILVPEMHV